MPISVNGERIEDSVLRAEMNLIRPQLFEAMYGEDPVSIEHRVRQWARDNVVERTVLRQAALSAQSDSPTPDSAEQAVEKLLAKITENVARPRNKDIVDYYRKHRASFERPEQVRAAHIVKNVDDQHPEDAARAAIHSLAAQLAGGAEFERLADTHSDCPGRGGDLGFFERGRMVDEFERVVFAMNPGEVSPVFRTPFGFHIVKLNEKRAAGIPKLEEIRDEIEETIFQEKRRKVIEQYLDRLMAKADVRDL